MKLITKCRSILNMRLFSQIYNRKRLHVGKNSVWGFGCVFNCLGGLYIGNNVLISSNVSIFTTHHNYKNPFKLIKNQGHKNASVIIGSDVWIGANTTILKGVIIGTGSIIGANSLIPKNKIVFPYSVNVGNPLREIKKRR